MKLFSQWKKEKNVFLSYRRIWLMVSGVPDRFHRTRLWFLKLRWWTFSSRICKGGGRTFTACCLNCYLFGAARDKMIWATGRLILTFIPGKRRIAPLLLFIRENIWNLFGWKAQIIPFIRFFYCHLKQNSIEICFKQRKKT